MANIEHVTTVTVVMDGDEADLIAAALTILKESDTFANKQQITIEEKQKIADLRRAFLSVLPD